MALLVFKELAMKRDSDHTVEYTSIDYHSMCQKSKDRIKKMQKEGYQTPYDPKDSPEKVGEDGYSIIMMGKHG